MLQLPTLWKGWCSADGWSLVETYIWFVFSTARNKITDDHLWVSVLSRPTRSNFTRVQRVTCCIALLFSTMIANAMFFGNNNDSPGNKVIVSMGTVVITTDTLLISIYATMIVLPVNLLIVTLFRKSRPKHQWDLPQDIAKRQGQPQQQAPNESDVRKILFPTSKSQMKEANAAVNKDTGAISHKKRYELPREFQAPAADIPPPRKTKWWKRRHPLPHWCIYIAYFLALAVCTISFYFCFMYSLQWGGRKSNEWLAALFLSFFQDVLLIQPIKVSQISTLPSYNTI